MTIWGAINDRNYIGKRSEIDISTSLIPYFTLKREISKEDNLDGCYFCLKYNPSGDFLATSRAEQIQIWDAHTGDLLHNLLEHKEVVTTVEWLNCEEPLFFSASLDKTIILWRNFKPIKCLTQHNDWIRSLGVSHSNKCLVSGCVSSEICFWDATTGHLLNRIPNAHSHPSCSELNTINTLQFAKESDDVFISGARDGYVKLWDRREGFSSAVLTIAAHKKKVNNVVFNFDNSEILSGGRDHSLKLWDSRTLSSNSPQIEEIKSYCKHQSCGYNVTTSYFNNEKHLMTGSEDKSVYIYDKETGEVVKKLNGHSGVVHLVTAFDSSRIISTSIENSILHVWEPNIDETGEPKLTSLNDNSSKFEEIENILHQHGDQILKVFHKYNVTFSSHDSSPFSSMGTDNESAWFAEVVQYLAKEITSINVDESDHIINNNNNNHHHHHHNHFLNNNNNNNNNYDNDGDDDSEDDNDEDFFERKNE